MNKTILMGRLTKDPEVKYLQDENSTAMARYTLAVDRRYRKDGKAETDFISCVTFGKNAEFAEKYLKKGLKILVSGRIQTGSYVNQEGNLYAMKEYFETRPVYLELKKKYFGREKFKEEHKKELSGYYRSERILKENLDPSGKIPEGQWKREAASLSEEIDALRKEDKRIHAMLRKYEGIKNHVEALMAEEGEGVSLLETNKREYVTETKEAVRTMRPKKKHHGMEL